jgi:hypothetical protein
MLDYTPRKRENPPGLLPQTAWGNIPTILQDVIDRFSIPRGTALEFGVEYGYSTSALAHYFRHVTGVDTFTGDTHSGIKRDHYAVTKSLLRRHPNVELVQADYRDFISGHGLRHDLIHVDIVHTYEDTYRCGRWALDHARVVIFHDTESFGDVKRACTDLAREFGLAFYNYRESHGLGIIAKTLPLDSVAAP